MTTDRFLEITKIFTDCRALRPLKELPEVFKVAAALEKRGDPYAMDRFTHYYRRNQIKDDLQSYIDNLNELSGLPAHYVIYFFVDQGANKSLAFKRFAKALYAKLEKERYYDLASVRSLLKRK